MIIKESYGDGRIERREIERSIRALEELLEVMNDTGIDSVFGSPNTYGLSSRFLGTSSGYLDLNNIDRYIESLYDEETDEEE